MRLSNLNFDTWEANHDAQHHAKWSRYLYPFQLLNSLDYDATNVGSQTAKGRHKLWLISIELQPNGRYKAIVDVSPNWEVGKGREQKSNARQKRRWNCRFVVIYTPEGEFITVYTEREDPTRKFVKSFLKGDSTESEGSHDYTVAHLMREILDPGSETYQIRSSEIRECLDVMRSSPNTLPSLFYYLSAMNLLNAWANRKQKSEDGQYRFVTELYHFKRYLSQTVDHWLIRRQQGLGFYIQSDVLIVELYGFQFGFHQVKKTARMKLFEARSTNQDSPWKGRRLQPIAPLILEFARYVVQQGLAADAVPARLKADVGHL